MQDDVRAIPALITTLFQTVRALNRIYPDRPFTPDGHLVGSIGEVIAADTYDLALEKNSNEGFDAKTKDGRTVEIKLTGGDSVAVASDGQPPDLLVVLKLDPAAGFTEVYNGEFPLDLWQSKKATKRRVRSLPLNQLKRINPKLLVQVHPLDELNKLFAPSDLP